MNLLGKIKIIGALVLGTTILFSCEKSGSFGFNSDEVTPVEFLVYQTPITSSVVQLDTVFSSNLNSGLIGVFDDPNFGKVKATTYSRLNLRRDFLGVLSSEAILDSVKLNFRITYLRDTLIRSLDLEMYKLDEVLEDTLHITSNSTAISDELIVSGSFILDEIDSIYSLNITSSFADNLFELMRNADPTIATQESFESIFPGVAFKTEGSIENIFRISLDAASNITFYYKDLGSSGEVDLALTHELTFGSLPHYYGLEVDRRTSDLSGLRQTNFEFTPSTNLRYVQEGTGLVTKLDLSSLLAFADSNDGIIVNSAQVSLGPIEDFGVGLTPPITLFFALTDDENTVIRDGSTFRTMQRDGASQIGSNAPVQLTYNVETKTYEASITTFVNSYYTSSYRRNSFFVYPQGINNSLNQFIFDPNNISIKVFYSRLR
jgi:hypothetical protein